MSLYCSNRMCFFLRLARAGLLPLARMIEATGDDADDEDDETVWTSPATRGRHLHHLHHPA